MEALRIHGKPPYSVVVVHGGPGAPGYMAPVARELSSTFGVLEPLQTAASVKGQLGELHETIRQHAKTPLALIGSSWGAMLGFMLAAHWPDTVRKLILVGSGVFREKYAEQIMDVRLSRLDAKDRREAERLLAELQDDETEAKNLVFDRLGALMTKADSFDPLTLDIGVESAQYDLHCSVWNDATELRRSGKLLELGKLINCPVVAIHGDYDPHPPEGIREPLALVLNDFRFITLENCGHYPWIERQARLAFFDLVRRECI